MVIRLNELSSDERLQLYERAMEIRREKGIGRQKISKELDLCASTVGEWLHQGRKPDRPRGHQHKLNVEPSANLSYIIGVIKGDGCLTVVKRTNAKRIILYAKDCDFVETFNKAICEILKREKLYPIWQRRDNDIFRVTACSAMLFDYLNQTIDNFEDVIQAYPADFIRGMADSEASPYSYGRRFRINFYNTNTKLLETIQKLLTQEFDIKSKIYLNTPIGHISNLKSGKKIVTRKTVYALTIDFKNDVIKFWKHIGFSIQRKQTKLNEMTQEIEKQEIERQRRKR